MLALVHDEISNHHSKAELKARTKQ